MIFYRRKYNEKIHVEDLELPCFVLKPIKGWNDYGHITRHAVYYYRDNNSYSIDIGETKILELDVVETIIPEVFNELDTAKFCSLGQSTNFYRNLLEHFGKDASIEILTKLNDVGFCVGLRDDYEHDGGYKWSLLRTSEAEKAHAEARRIIEGVPIDNAFKFSFKTKIGVEGKHEVNLNFSKGELPYRITAIIGKNGTGKTQYLARLANTLSGVKDEGEFEPNRPLFSKVIGVSYSLFDKFNIPKKSKTFSYVYSGLRNIKNEVISDEELFEKIAKSIRKIERRNRTFDWYNILNEMIDFQALNIGMNPLAEKQDYILMNEDGTSKLSSGQSIVLYVFTEIFANIDYESLILFDEPETHLHPNAIARLMKALNKILNKFNSYAIIATHSPIIVQEVPSEYVYVFKRDNLDVISRKLNFESFGENLTEINERIFNTIDIEQNYKEVQERLSENNSYDEVCELFTRNEKMLSFNAKVFLQSRYDSR